MKAWLAFFFFPSCLLELDILGIDFSDAGLQSWGIRCGVQTFCSSGGSSGTPGCEFHSHFGWLCWVWGLWPDCVSASPIHFDVGFFPCLPDAQELLKYFGGLFQRKLFFMYFSFSGLMKRWIQDLPTLPSWTGTHIHLNYLLGPTGVRYYLELWPKGNPGREIAAAAGNLHPEPTKKRSQQVKRI